MLFQIQRCTKAEVVFPRHGFLGNDFGKIPLIELQAFIALLYIRGAYGGRNIYINSFWNELSGISFFSRRQWLEISFAKF